MPSTRGHHALLCVGSKVAKWLRLFKAFITIRGRIDATCPNHAETVLLVKQIMLHYCVLPSNQHQLDPNVNPTVPSHGVAIVPAKLAHQMPVYTIGGLHAVRRLRL